MQLVLSGKDEGYCFFLNEVDQVEVLFLGKVLKVLSRF